MSIRVGDSRRALVNAKEAKVEKMLDEPQDLSFAQSPERDGARLTAAEIAHYNAKGFV